MDNTENEKCTYQKELNSVMQHLLSKIKRSHTRYSGDGTQDPVVCINVFKAQLIYEFLKELNDKGEVN